MSDKTTNKTGGNATPIIDALPDFLQEKKKTNAVPLFNAKKCLIITTPGSYIGIPTKVVTSGEQLAISFSIFDIDDPTLQYRSVRFWLNSEYADGEPEDEFYQTFDYPVSSDDIIGKSCIVEIAFTEKNDGSRIYPTITSFSKTS